MSKFWWFAAIVACSGAVAFQVFGHREASAPATTPQRRVQVTTEVAVKKKSPILIESLGNVTTFASVAIKPRIDDEIVGVHFTDGAEVKKDDLLITLDRRALEAQLRQAEATLLREMGCEYGQGYFFGRPGPLSTFRPQAESGAA